ncbi:MAG: sigma-70 family RNA polymerase sigma factor [Ruminococcaceae bacterium]|nr:sigma-70 family RNA polymerase sigma factor [Oscillospiraceae bacterium]
MNDDEMIQRLHDRDETVLAELDARYGRLCTTVAKNILGSDEDAAECRNDALLKIWNTIPPASPSSLKSYAAMAARCAAINRWNADRAKKRGLTSPLEELSDICGGGDVSDAVEAKELGEAINAFLAGCRRDDRILFVRRYVYGETSETAASAVGMSKNAANLRLFRLRAKLRNYLKERNLL